MKAKGTFVVGCTDSDSSASRFTVSESADGKEGAPSLCIPDKVFFENTLFSGSEVAFSDRK